MQNATFNILTPFPGTRLFQRLEAEGRILTRDWSKYNSRADVVFQPKNMSSEELLAGFQSGGTAVLFAGQHQETPVALARWIVVDAAVEFDLPCVASKDLME